VDTGSSGGGTDFASPEDRANVLAQLQLEQFERDKQRSDRDEQRAAHLEQLQVDQDNRDEQRAAREKGQVKWQKAQVIASMIGIVAVIVSVIALVMAYVNLEDQQDAVANQDQESRYSSVSQLSLDVDQMIAENPRLISCFRDVECNAKPALTRQEQDKAELIAVYIVDFYQYLYTQLESLNYIPRSGLFVFAHTPEASSTDENWVTWGETIYMGFQNSALACKALKDGEDAYEWKFVHAVYVAPDNICPDLPNPGPSPHPYS